MESPLGLTTFSRQPASSAAAQRNPKPLFQNHEFQTELMKLNRDRLTPSLPTSDWERAVAEESKLKLWEGEWIEKERAALSSELEKLPESPHDFLNWFEGLESSGPGQNDALFEWLEHSATAEQMRWFIAQEVAGEAGFEDLVALTQVKIPTRAKLEMARNYWDELGRGHEKGMHGPMLGRLADEMKVSTMPLREIVSESLALANMLTAFAANRRYAYHSIGALGAIELTAPARAARVHRGLARLGFTHSAQYYLLHSSLDVKHSRDWNAEVLYPLLCENPALARPIAEGAWLRLLSGARCFERYRSVLLPQSESAAELN